MKFNTTRFYIFYSLFHPLSHNFKYTSSYICFTFYSSFTLLFINTTRFQNLLEFLFLIYIYEFKYEPKQALPTNVHFILVDKIFFPLKTSYPVDYFFFRIHFFNGWNNVKYRYDSSGRNKKNNVKIIQMTITLKYAPLSLRVLSASYNSIVQSEGRDS